MINPTGKKLEKIIFKLFDDASQGVDRYNHNGSLWAIFTNETKWVVEFTKDQTLWYNYSFFKDEMELVSLDCVEDKDLIKKWFESRFLGIPKVEDLFDPFFDQDQYVEDIIQNGVKLTELSKRDFFPKDILQNGVKETKSLQIHLKKSIKDAIQNGVKEIKTNKFYANGQVEGIIKNGVRMTKSTIISQDSKVEDTIKNGVKETKSMCGNREGRISNTIENGVKETIGTLRRTCKWGVDDIIKNGVKHVEDGDWLDGDERFNNIIKNGVKKTDEAFYGQVYVEDIIQNGVKETYDDCSNNIARVEGIIRIGEKIS
jgi:flagellar capping protein FliD